MTKTYAARANAFYFDVAADIPGSGKPELERGSQRSRSDNAADRELKLEYPTVQAYTVEQVARR